MLCAKCNYDNPPSGQQPRPCDLGQRCETAARAQHRLRATQLRYEIVEPAVCARHRSERNEVNSNCQATL